MMGVTFGRTNLRFPKRWVALRIPLDMDESQGIEQYMENALKLDVPIDISAAPALFGGFLPYNSEAVLIQNSASDIELATDSRHAADLVQAHLIETLSGIGRPHVDFYFLRSRIALEEAQISGVLEALESARQEGHVRFFGLRIENFPASIGNWQFHDAFDVVSVPETLSSEDRQTVYRMAGQRRCGIILRTVDRDLDTPPNMASLVSVGSFQELEQLRSHD